jgi:hypothetical protein
VRDAGRRMGAHPAELIIRIFAGHSGPFGALQDSRGRKPAMILSRRCLASR